MRATRHMRQRMSQRGIRQKLVDFVLKYGRQEQDRFVLDRNAALELLEATKMEERLLRVCLRR